MTTPLKRALAAQRAVGVGPAKGGNRQIAVANDPSKKMNLQRRLVSKRSNHAALGAKPTEGFGFCKCGMIENWICADFGCEAIDLSIGKDSRVARRKIGSIETRQRSDWNLRRQY